MKNPLRVVVVDDTLTSRQLLVHIVNHSGDMQVVGEGHDGEQALKLARELKPDLLLMDIIMPRLNGLDATERIMQQTPLPIILITASLEVHETDIAFRGIRAGALSVLQKPQGLNPDEISHVRATIRALAGVKVIHHFSRSSPQPDKPTQRDQSITDLTICNPRIVGIAASTGGPAALAEIIKNITVDFPLPIIIVQHISPDFILSMAAWLETLSPLPIEVAKAGDLPIAGTIYIAPANYHLSIQTNGRFHLEPTAGTWRYMPSCDVLLFSLAHVYGRHAIGIVLTGMGDDGADGLRAMYEAGAITIAQDQATSVVYGMPYEALNRGGVQHVMSLSEISTTLNRLNSLD